MGFDQYHEPAQERPDDVRTFARMIVSLAEEADAINWYEQRMAVEKNAEAEAIMQDSQLEEFKHFAMDLEFLIRRKPSWKAILQGVLFKTSGIVENALAAEQQISPAQKGAA